jgi:hypothetical protein
MTRGQKAMLAAIDFPEPEKGGRGNKAMAIVAIAFSPHRLSHARTVLKYLLPDDVAEVVAGTLTLDAAYAQTQEEKQRLRPSRRQSLSAAQRPAKGFEYLAHELDSHGILRAACSPSTR